MAGPAPTEIQHIDQQEAELYKKMASDVGQATGQPTTPQALKPEDSSSLKKIEAMLGDTTHVVGSTFEETIGSKTSEEARVRSTGGRVPISIDTLRRLKQKFSKKTA